MNDDNKLNIFGINGLFFDFPFEDFHLLFGTPL